MKPQPVTCERCGHEALVDWLEVTRMGDPEIEFAMGNSHCPTPDCVNEDGSSMVMPPDQPGELTRDDRRLIDGYRRLLRQLDNVTRQLLDAVYP